jgi:lipopolysaccharide export system protein LptC
VSIAPLSRVRPNHELTQSGNRRKPPTKNGIVRRHFLIAFTKRALPVFALLTLASIALWPQISRQLDQGRITYRRLAGQVDAGQLRDARYRGMDVRGRPYTITADAAAQAGPERVDLTEPKGDIVTEGGSWMMVQSHTGVYMQHAGQLDMSGDATVYRDDGITMRTAAMAVDVNGGAASSNEKTHVEGPFGTLDAQGFTMVDKGGVVQFHGPSRLLLNESRK